MLLRLARVCLALAVAVPAAHLSAQTPAHRGAGGFDPTSRNIGSHVRGATPLVTELIKGAVRRSPTFAALVEALNQTDVIVYIESTRQLPSGIDGRLTFSGVNGSLRYVRAQVTVDLTGPAMLAVAGHELQHALEVAQHSEVRDADTLAGLYRRIGSAGSERGLFDTAAARQVGRRVRLELG
jgi:hypothetical protein